MHLPGDLKYSKDHEWLRLEGTNAILGITDFAAEQLGDIVFIDLPKVGAIFKTGDVLGVVESTKTASDIFYPINGKILAINEALLESPELINQEPYGKGWFVKIECTDLSELDALLDANAYASLT